MKDFLVIRFTKNLNQNIRIFFNFVSQFKQTDGRESYTGR